MEQGLERWIDLDLDVRECTYGVVIEVKVGLQRASTDARMVVTKMVVTKMVVPLHHSYPVPTIIYISLSNSLFPWTAVQDIESLGTQSAVQHTRKGLTFYHSQYHRRHLHQSPFPSTTTLRYPHLMQFPPLKVHGLSSPFPRYP